MIDWKYKLLKNKLIITYGNILENNGNWTWVDTCMYTVIKFHCFKSNTKSIDRVSLIMSELEQQVDGKQRKKETLFKLSYILSHSMCDHLNERDNISLSKS